MQTNKKTITEHFDAVCSILMWAIILLGTALRITVFFQNRPLIIDEVNIVRNLHERGFFGLLKPMKYEQYAPPTFLWMEELSSIIFGFGELGLKVYPLLTGIAGMVIMRAVLLKLMPPRAAWFPLLLMSVTYFYILYSTSIKQYMPDAMITLILVWLALHYDIQTTKRSKFIKIWATTGMVAVWSSMPSIFVLTGIGCYYGWQSMRQKWYMFSALIISASVWVANFALYYFLILSKQVGLKNLKDYHAKYFLHAWPNTPEKWDHNTNRIREVILSMGGYYHISLRVYGSFLLLGIIAMLIRRTQLFFLLILPVLLTFVAAAFDQFSLIERVILFMMPLLLIAMGYGFSQLMSIRFVPIYLVGIYAGFFVVKNYNELKLFKEPIGGPEITKGFDFILQSGGKGNELFVHDATHATYIYYTSIHPRNPAHSQLQGATMLGWDDNYASIMRFYKGDKAYFLFTGGMYPEEVAKRNAELADVVMVDSFGANTCMVKVYKKKPAQ